jgi:hypothetical protein
MADVNVAVINRSTVVTDDQASALVKVLQKQVDNDFAPIWGCPANLTFVPLGKPADLRAWWLTILDDSDQAGDLGYHDLTPAGLPLGKAFAKSDMEYKTSWTVTVSHELLEMLADPNINLTVFDQGPIGARLYAYEVCDACEDDQFGYMIDDTLVSDFVYPSWFESFRVQGTTVFDAKQHINAPFQLLTGGYIGVNDLASGWGWSQTTPAGEDNARARPPQGSRRQRRAIPPLQRIRSTVKV